MDRMQAWYALAVAQVGARAGLRLLEAFQQPEAILAATPGAWVERAKLTPAACDRLLEAANRDYAADLERLERLGITLLSINDPAYPARLRAIADPPYLLFVKGQLAPEDERAIAIVGSRRASPYGRHVSAELAHSLAQKGFTVVSGMALGADAAAHEGALRAGGRTIAVLGSGIDVVYPPEHVLLYDRIAAAGAVVSELPPGAPPAPMNFPQRNRIISGLCLGVVVVEAPEKSGALITAGHALDQGREVFAIPGSVNSVQSRGTHQLLRDGARLVESAEDILDELSLAVPLPAPRKINPMAGPNWDVLPDEEDVLAGEEAATPPPPTPPAKPRKQAAAPPSAPPPAPTPALPPEEEAVLRLLSTTAKLVDTLIEEAKLPPAQVNAALLMLELKGHIQRRPGNVYVRLR